MTDNAYAGILPDNGLPWPRELVVHGYANKEIRSDPGVESTKWWLDQCDRSCDHAGVKLADGEQWEVTWSEVTQREIDLENSCLEIEGQEPTWMRAGDWRYRAIGKVVPL